jgi:hypothetical protein
MKKKKDTMKQTKLVINLKNIWRKGRDKHIYNSYYILHI